MILNLLVAPDDDEDKPPLSPKQWCDIVDSYLPSPDIVHVTGPAIGKYPDLCMLLRCLDRDGRRIVLSGSANDILLVKDAVIKHCKVVYVEATTESDREFSGLMAELRDAGLDCRLRFLVDEYNICDMVAVYTLGYPVMFVHGKPGTNYDLELLYRCMFMCKTAVFQPNIISRSDLKKYYSRGRKYKPDPEIVNLDSRGEYLDSIEPRYRL